MNIKRPTIVSNEVGGGYGSAIGSILGLAAGIVLAPYTGGASLYVTAALSITGGVVGRVIDNATMSRPSGPQPQIQDLAIQTTTYGTMIPKLYGKFSVAGNIIQATAKVPHIRRNKPGGGSGGFGGSSATTTTLSYTVSIVIGICEGPIDDVVRVWADDTIVFPAATISSGPDTYQKIGETPSGVIAYFTLYKGTETQDPDPFFESIVGTGNQPSYRGLAYAVFQHLELGSVGRVPNFRFEVVKSNTQNLTSAVTSICTDCGLVAGDLDISLGTGEVNFLVSSIQSGKSVLDQLAETFNFIGIESENKIKFRLKQDSNTPVATITEDFLSGGIDNPDQESMSVMRLQETDLPTKITVNYASADRNYHTASQIIQLANSKLNDNPIVVGFDVALSETQARKLAVSLLYDPWTNRELASGSLPFMFVVLDPFDFVSITARGLTYLLRIVEMNHGSNWLYTFKALEFDPELAGITAPPITTLPPPVTTETLSPSNIIILDAPPLKATDVLPRYFATAYPTTLDKFANASLYNSLNNISYDIKLSAYVAATTGNVATALPTASKYVWDNTNTLTVVLNSAESVLLSYTDFEVYNGANLAMYGNECIAFGTATLIGARTYALTHLLRGRQGTESYIGTHTTNERFILLDSIVTDVGRVPYTVDDVGISEYYKITDPFTTIVTAVAFQQTLNGISIKPWAPILLSASCDVPSTDDYTFNWYHRSRLKDAVWQQGSGIVYDLDDTGMYRIRIYTNSSYTTVQRLYTTTAFPSADDVRTFVYPIADQIIDFGSHPATVYYSIQTLATISGYESFGIATCP